MVKLIDEENLQLDVVLKVNFILLLKRDLIRNVFTSMGTTRRNARFNMH